MYRPLHRWLPWVVFGLVGCTPNGHPVDIDNPTSQQPSLRLKKPSTESEQETTAETAVATTTETTTATTTETTAATTTKTAAATTTETAAATTTETAAATTTETTAATTTETAAATTTETAAATTTTTRPTATPAATSEVFALRLDQSVINFLEEHNTIVAQSAIKKIWIQTLHADTNNHQLQIFDFKNNDAKITQLKNMAEFIGQALYNHDHPSWPLADTSNDSPLKDLVDFSILNCQPDCQPATITVIAMTNGHRFFILEHPSLDGLEIDVYNPHEIRIAHLGDHLTPRPIIKLTNTVKHAFDKLNNQVVEKIVRTYTFNQDVFGQENHLTSYQIVDETQDEANRPLFTPHQNKTQPQKAKLNLNTLNQSLRDLLIAKILNSRHEIDALVQPCLETLDTQTLKIKPFNDQGICLTQFQDTFEFAGGMTLKRTFIYDVKEQRISTQQFEFKGIDPRIDNQSYRAPKKPYHK